MGAWSKMMTAPSLHPGGALHPPSAAHLAALDKMMAAHQSAEEKEKALESPPHNHEDIASFKALSTDELNGASDLDSEMASENDEEVPPAARDTSGEITRDSNHSDKLEASHKEILDKLSRRHETEDHVERELSESDALRNETAQDLRLDSSEDSDKDNKENLRLSPGNAITTQTEIKTQRPPGLLAQHGLMTHKHNNNSTDRSTTESNTPLKERDFLHHHHSIKSERGGGSGGSIPPPPHMGPLDFTHPAFLERQFSRPPSTPGSPPSIGGDALGTHTGGHHWTFEEQFKQLYELSEDPKRKEFLDDLFSFMQKRGTPVNRIPIMAKQPLDLYELFRLVVSKGGLVEVINKKLWREICKGLNLPSSITSAAFTLRTQYMKYLYPYECDKLKLSNPAELQAAIDGNRREGRRPGYGYDFSPIPTMIPPSPHVLNGGFLNGRHPLHPDDDGLGSPPPHMRSLAEREHLRAMEAAHHVMEEAKKRMEEAHAHRGHLLAPPPPHLPPFSKEITSSLSNGSLRNTSPVTSRAPSSSSDTPDAPPAKRPALSDNREDESRDREREAARERLERFMGPPPPPPHLMAGMPSAHLKITSRNDGRADFDNSLVVSMEVNGIMYQGVLFAQHPPPRRI